MPSQSPLWRRGFDRLERVIGEPLEVAARSDAFFDGVALARRTQEALTGLARALSRRSLHLFGIPAESDVRHLREQLAHVDRQLREISKQLEAPATRPIAAAPAGPGGGEQVEHPGARQLHQSDGAQARRTTRREPAAAPSARPKG
jgi:hypothetical protein